MRAYKSYIDNLVRKVHFCHQAVLVAFDFKRKAIIA